MAERFVKLEPSFYRHRKTLRLRRKINDGAFWIPPALWAHCIERETDDVSDYNGDDLAAVLDYSGDGDALKAALVECGFISGDGKTVVGWQARYGAVFAFYKQRATKAAEVRWGRDTETPTVPTEKGEKEEKKRSDVDIEVASSKNASSMLQASEPLATLETQNDPAFTAETIYDAYPRKQARKDAIVAIEKALRENPASYLFQRVTLFAQAVTRWSEHDRSKFVPHPATWFNRGSYDDDPKTWERNYSNPHQRVAATAEDHLRDGFR